MGRCKRRVSYDFIGTTTFTRKFSLQELHGSHGSESESLVFISDFMIKLHEIGRDFF